MRNVAAKFFADRGTHLAAMIAYFALLSFVPLLYLALSLLGYAGRFDESSFLISELKRAFPGASLNTILDAVRSIQNNSAALGIVGGSFLLWSSLSLFSVLESAFNIVYDRPNRGFLRGKAIASLLLVTTLVFLFGSLLVGSVGYDVMKRYAPGFAGNGYFAYAVSVLVSLIGVFIFLLSVYYVLTNDTMTLREVLPGSLVCAVVLEASFQAIPVYLRVVNKSPAAAIGGPAILLIWLYVMANVIVFGAEINWARRRRERGQTP